MMSILFLCAVSAVVSTRAELLQVNVVFRHGARHPTLGGYPKYTEKFVNNGKLVTKGKLQGLLLGNYLRKRYDKFLGNEYSYDIMQMQSTKVERSEMTGLSVLAALWQPQKGNKRTEYNEFIVPGLNWLPVPYTTDNEKILSYPQLRCESVFANNIDIFTSTATFDPYRSIIQYIEENTGYKNITLIELTLLYSFFEAQNWTGVKLPEWSKKIYPQPLNFIAGHFYVALTITEKSMQVASGMLLKKILDDGYGKITEQPNTRKMYLYSGHEYNVAFLMRALNVFYPHVPPYTANIMIELHKEDRTYGFKIFYNNFTSTEPIKLTIPGCTFFCPLHKVSTLLQNHIHNSNSEC